MLGPNHLTHDLATRTHQERLSHAARIRMIQRERRDGSQPLDKTAFRHITVARLAATGAAFIFSLAVVATAAAAGASGGGGATMLLY